MNIETKKTGSSLSSSEFNQIPDELENIITNAGIEKSATNLTQISQSISQMVGDADFYSTSGTANDIILSPVSPRLAPASLTNGLRVRFKAIYNNTDVATVNVAGLGAKNITSNDVNIASGNIVADKVYELVYKLSTDSFELMTRDFSSLLNKNMITNCILEAPNGIATFSGSTVTIKSGIKYLTGIGRNTDFSFKNAEYITEIEQNITFKPVQGGYAYVYLINNVPAYCPVSETYFFDNVPSVEAPQGKSGNNQLWFNLWDNEIYHSNYGSTEWVKVNNLIIIGKAYFQSDASSTIVALRVNLPVDLLQRKDKAEISGWGMPSNKYIDLTLGTSGSRYTAPANGWFTCYVGSLTRTGYLYMRNNSNQVIMETRSASNGTAVSAYIPVRKNQSILINYDVQGTVNIFRFVYANGEEN